MVKEHINAADAYAPPWHFNQAVKVTEGTSMIFLSALAGYQPDGTLAESDVVAQAEAAFENMAKVVRAAGGSLADVVKTTVYVREDFLEYRDALRAIRSVTSRRITQHPRSCRWSASPTPTTFSRSKQ